MEWKDFLCSGWGAARAALDANTEAVETYAGQVEPNLRAKFISSFNRDGLNASLAALASLC